MIKSKEEILKLAHPDESYTTPPLANYQTVYNAMDVFAEQESIAFAEWVSLKKGMWFDDEYLLWNLPDFGEMEEWMQEHGYGFPENQFRFSTEELYQLFLNSKSKKQHE